MQQTYKKVRVKNIPKIDHKMSNESVQGVHSVHRTYAPAACELVHDDSVLGCSRLARYQHYFATIIRVYNTIWNRIWSLNQFN